MRNGLFLLTHESEKWKKKWLGVSPYHKLFSHHITDNGVYYRRRQVLADGIQGTLLKRTRKVEAFIGAYPEAEKQEVREIAEGKGLLKDDPHRRQTLHLYAPNLLDQLEVIMKRLRLSEKTRGANKGALHMETWEIGKGEAIVFTTNREFARILGKDFGPGATYFRGATVVGWHFRIPKRTISFLRRRYQKSDASQEEKRQNPAVAGQQLTDTPQEEFAYSGTKTAQVDKEIRGEERRDRFMT